MKKDSIIQYNPQYTDALPQWQMVEDAVKGQECIKKESTKYLPKPNSDDDSEGNKARYEQYKLRAVYYNTVYRTLSAMVGAAFRKEPVVDVPANIDYIKSNADGGGLTLEQQTQWTLSEVLKKGRCGLLVDYPRVEGSTSRADVERGVRATIKGYSAEKIIDWNEERTETGMQLNYVKLCEIDYKVDIDTGYREEDKRYIVLRLIDGVYSVEHYNDLMVSAAERVEPRDASGRTFNYIPFIFTGSENNSPDIDQALLYDLAVLNIAHYRNSADNEETSFITGQPTLGVTSSLSSLDWEEQNPNGVKIGSRTGHFLGDNGNMFLVQADPNTLPRELMKDKEAQMVSLGAQLVMPTGNETAFSTGVKLSTNTSALSLAVKNVSDAYEKCLGWVNQFMSTSDYEVVYSINTDFFPANVDAATITAWVSAIHGQLLPRSPLFSMIRDANLTQLTDEELIAEIESSTTGLDLSGGGGAGNGL